MLLIGGYIALQNSRVQTLITQKLAKQLSERINSKVSIGKVYFSFFNKLVLEDVLLEDQQNDTLFYSQKITAGIDSLKYKKRKIALNTVTFSGTRINIEKDTADHFNFTFMIDSLRTPGKSAEPWKLSAGTFSFNHSNIAYTDSRLQTNENYFIKDLNLSVSDFLLNKDSLNFNIEQLTMNDGKNLEIENLSAKVSTTSDSLKITGFNIETQASAINNSAFIIAFPDSVPKSVNTMEVDLNFSNSIVSLYELAQLIPTLEGMDQVVNFSGQIYGKLNDIKGKNLLLKTGQYTSAAFDLYVNDITDPKNMYLFLDLKNSQTTFNDLSSIKLPASAERRYLSFPESFYHAGILRYKGNFTGFLTDFVAFGTLTSRMGTLRTDVAVVPETAGKVSYRGKVATKNFRLGEFFKNEMFGKITFDGSVDGNFNQKTQEVFGKFDGEIAQFEVNGYNYENIELDGTLNNKMFDGIVNIDDPNLKFNFAGQVNLNPEVPVFDFRLNLKKAMPGKLNLSKNFPGSNLSFFMLANFRGNKIDNLEGSIVLADGLYSNRNGSINLDGMELQSAPNAPTGILTFTSNFFDFNVTGKYHFQTLLNAFEKSINKYLPATNYEKLAQAGNNNFEFVIEAKNLDSLTAVFTPGFKVQTPFLLYGKLNSEKSVFELEGSIPGVSTNTVLMKDIFIGNGPQDDIYASKFRLGEVTFRNGMKLYNLTIDSKLSDNEIQNQISWTNFHKLTYSGRIITKAVFTESEDGKFPHIAIEGFPTKVYIADSLWQIAPFTANIDSSNFEINNFKFYNGKQSITVDGSISEDAESKLTASFDNISLWSLDEYMNRDFSVGGTLNGTAGIADYYNQRFVFSNLIIEDFVFKDQVIGKIWLTNNWDYYDATLSSEVKIEKNERESLYANGTFNPKTKKLLYNAQVDQLSVVVLETILGKNFSNFHGTASGHMKIEGTPDNFDMNGALMASNAGLTVDYTQVKYNFSDSVYFKGDTILFDKIKILDERGNTGTFNGTIVHQNFQHMEYNLSVVSPKILAFNTTPRNNSEFFGQIIASGRFDITGFGASVNLSGTATTLNGTNVNISLESEGDLERYDFIRFVSKEEAEKQEFTFPQKSTDDFSLNLSIHATPDARVQLIYNSQIGDVIKAQGEGYLLFGIDKEGNIALSGNYTVEKGDYLFTLQNVINKRFSIEQGGTIVWSGDPYDAVIDLKAVYKLKASVYDLLKNIYNNVYQNQRIPVECKIILTENLSNPDIQFDIDFPTVDTRLTSELSQYFNSQEEMNRQILSLVVLGKFYVPDYMRGTYEAQNPNLIGTTASELFSNQLSNWLSQINNNVDIGFNYRPGNQITDDEIELALSTQMFNDRVTINGNIGNNVNPYSSNNSQLVGDFEVNVKLNPSGKVQLKAYNRSNNNLIYETSPYTQGVGFSFTEEYNTFKQLVNKFTAIFGKKEEN